MPTQALIRNLTRAQIDGPEQDLLEFMTYGDVILVRCKTDDNGNIPGAAEALQKLCDADTAAMIAKAKKAETE